MSELDRLNAQRAELDRIFDLVIDAADWRAPIDQIVEVESADDLTRIKDAVAFFTGTDATFADITYTSAGKLRVRVAAVGYRNGPAGP